MTFVILIGSNCGDRHSHIKHALDAIGKISRQCNTSHIYESPDINGSGKKYLNLVLEIVADSSESELNIFFKSIETEAGRDEAARERGDVPLDVDIVVCDGKIRRPDDFHASYFRRGYQELRKVPVNLKR